MRRDLLLARLRWWLPVLLHALRRDPLFRYALLGIALSLLVLLSHPAVDPATATSAASPAPPLLPAPADLGLGYGMPAASSTPEPLLITPGRPLPAPGDTPGVAAPLDGFGTVHHQQGPP